MNCKKCGSPLTENDQFCKNCGTAVNEISVPNTNTIGNDMNYKTPTNNMSSPVGQPMNSSINNDMNNTTNNVPTWENSYNQQPTYNQMSQKNNGNTKFIIIGIIIALAIFAGIVIVGSLNNNETTLTNNSTSGATQVNNSSTYKVNFNGFTLKIPTNLIYETDTDVMYIGDEEETWISTIQIFEGSYSQLQSKKGQMQTALQQQGYTATPAEEKTIAGNSFITLEVSKSGENILLGYAKANSMYVFGVTVYNTDNEFDYNLLSTIAPILNSAEYKGETNNMQNNIQIDQRTISELAK